MMNIMNMLPIYGKQDEDNFLSMKARADLAKIYGIQSPLNTASGIPNQFNQGNNIPNQQNINPSQGILNAFSNYSGSIFDDLFNPNYQGIPASSTNTYNVGDTTATEVNRVDLTKAKPKDTPKDKPKTEGGGLLDDLSMSDIQGLMTIFNTFTSTPEVNFPDYKVHAGNPIQLIDPYDQDRRLL